MYYDSQDYICCHSVQHRWVQFLCFYGSTEWGMDRLLQSSGKKLNAPCLWYITQGWLQIPTQLKPTQAQSWDNAMPATTKSKIPGV